MREQVDVIIDLVGGPQWPAMLTVLRPDGRYAVSGAIGGPIVELDLRPLYLKDLTLFGCTSQDDGVFEDLVGYLERGELVPIVAATYPLAEIAAAQRRLRGETPCRQARSAGAAGRLIRRCRTPGAESRGRAPRRPRPRMCRWGTRSERSSVTDLEF